MCKIFPDLQKNGDVLLTLNSGKDHIWYWNFADGFTTPQDFPRCSELNMTITSFIKSGVHVDTKLQLNNFL